MRRDWRAFHILDEDLDRITLTERAQMQAFRPMLRLGAVILICSAVLIVILGLTGSRSDVIGLGVGLLVAGWLGLAIGSNDVANSLGPAVGAGAIGLIPGLLLVAVSEIAGAVLAGDPVSRRLAEGIFDIGMVGGAGQLQVMMVAALIGAAAWISFATGAGLPVSTSHSIVGAIAGASVAALGQGSVHWEVIGVITLAWVISPMISGCIAALLVALINIHIVDAEQPDRAARRWLPVLVGVTAALFAAYLGDLSGLSPEPVPGPLIAVLVGFPAGWMMYRRTAQDLRENGGKIRKKRLFGMPLVISVAIMAFAHGANDVANVAGPASVLMAGDLAYADGAGSWVALLAAGLAIAAGTVLFGRRLVVMVGSGITRLNALRSFCVALATAITVLISSSFGLPVSTTHVAVGGVFGVGFAREWLDRRRRKNRAHLPAEETRRRLLIRRSHVVTISAAWLVTVPATATLSAIGYLLIRMVAAG